MRITHLTQIFLNQIRSSDRLNALNIMLLLLLSQFVVQVKIFRWGFLINGGDINFPLIPSLEAYRSMWVWDERFATGVINSRNVPSLFPYLAFLVLFERLGMPLFVSQTILLGIEFFITGFGAYYMVMTIFDIQGRNRQTPEYVAGLVSALFYMFNTYTLELWAAPDFKRIGSYAGSPLLLALFIKGTNAMKPKYILAVAMVSLLFASVASNPVYFALMLLPTMAYSAYIILHDLFFDKRRAAKSILYSLATMACIVGFNFWWVLPMAGEATRAQMEIGESLWTWLEWKSGSASVVNVLRLISSGIWWGGSLSYGEFYRSNSLAILSLIFPIAAFSSLLKKNRYVIFFSLLALTNIFLAKGIHPPFEDVNQWLYLNVPGFWAFRSVEYFLQPLILGYSYLIGVSVSSVYAELEKSQRNPNRHQHPQKAPAASRIRVFTRSSIVASSIIILIAAYPWPFWAGNVVYERQEEMLYPFRMILPEYYQEAARWLDANNEDFRIFSLPPKSAYVYYTWGYAGGDISLTLFNKPIIDTMYGQSYEQNMIPLMHYLLYTNSTESLGKLLGMMNVRYVLLHRDAVWQNIEDPYVHRKYRNLTRTFLRQQDGIVLKKVLGKLEFYVNQFFMDRVYATRNVWHVTGTTDSLRILGSIISLKEFSSDSVILFSKIYGFSEPYVNLFSNFSRNIVVVQEAESGYVRNMGWRVINETEARKEGTFTEVSSLVGRGPVTWMVEENLLRNPSFEMVDPNDPLMPEGWSYVEISSPKAVAKRVNDTASHGVYSFKIFRESGLPQLRSDKVEIEGNMHYALSFSLKVDSPKAKAVQYEIIWFTKKGEVINYDSGFTDGATEWNMYQIRALSPPNAAEADVRFTIHGNVTAYFDAVQFGKPLLNLVSYNVNIPESGDYSLYAYVRWDGMRGSLRSRIDNGKWSEAINPLFGSVGDSANYKYQAVRLGKWRLEKGTHNIDFENTLPVFFDAGGYQNIDYFFLVKISNATDRTDPILRFKKINPCTYRVNVKTSSPFLLVFSESYSPDWSASINGVEVKEHLFVNGYANAWYINKNGSYDIDLFFKPQRLFSYGVFSTPLIMTTVIAILLIDKRKAIRKIIIRNRIARDQTIDKSGLGR